MAIVIRSRPVFMPSLGNFTGGRLDGWRYLFRRFELDDEGMVMVAVCTPPNWPFPRELAVDGSLFRRLEAVAGAHRVDVGHFMSVAFGDAGRQPPAWLTNSRFTVRQALRNATPKRKAR